MPVYLLDSNAWFPPPSEYSQDVVAIGGDLHPERLLLGYTMGIFPWYNEPGEIMWWCPEVRSVLYFDHLRISHSMRNEIRQRRYRISTDTAFRDVLEGCRGGVRIGNTWLIDEMVEAYTELHQRGLAHSVEVWDRSELVGGLYGISLGHVFFGESMFSRKPNTSKLAFIWLSQQLQKLGWKMMDCQVPTEHLESLGASKVERSNFLSQLDIELKYPTMNGPWKFDSDFPII